MIEKFTVFHDNRMILQFLDGTEIEAPKRSGDPARLVASSEKARNILGWNPTHYSLEEIIADAWNWHKNHPEFNSDNADMIIKNEIGKVFEQVLCDAAVFKRDTNGIEAFRKFVNSVIRKIVKIYC